MITEGHRARLWQHAAVQESHDLGHACACGLGRNGDHRPGGEEHEAQGVHHVEQPGAKEVGIPYEPPALFFNVLSDAKVQKTCICHWRGSKHLNFGASMPDGFQSQNLT